MSCHAEPIRCTQGKLREASRGPSRETLRGAQGDTVWQLMLTPMEQAPLLLYA